MKNRYGRWTVLDPQEKGPTVLCLCDCGTLRHIPRKNLGGGKTRSCGCARTDKLRGQTFPQLAPDQDTQLQPGAHIGWWTVLAEPYKKPHSRYTVVDVACRCGNQATVRADNLTSGRSKSCGCLRQTGATAMHKDTP